MPYSSTSELPARVRKMPAKKRRQWMHVWNSTYQRTKDEGRAFAAANSVVRGKKELETTMSLTRVVGDKSVKVTLFTGVDDPDLPDHVASMPTGLRSRWVNNYNWAAQELMDDDSAEERADEYTSMSVADLLEAGVIGAKGESNEDGEGTAPAPVPAPGGAIQAGVLPAPKSKPTFLERLNAAKEAFKAVPSAAPSPRVIFDVYKGVDGVHRAFMVYSNIFQDKTGEIISEAAHKEYEEWVEQEGLYPEFHYWHGGPDTRWGRAEHIAYVDGFAIAGGVVDPGKEHVALKLKEKADRGELAVSHGLIGLRGPDGVYLLYRSFEISPLPVGSEANPWTSINLLELKESDMPFKESKKKAFKEVYGWSDEAIEQAEKNFDAMTSSLKTAGVAWREAETPNPPTPPQPNPPQPPDPAPQPPPPNPQDATLATQVMAMTDAVKGLADVVAGLKQQVDAQVANTGKAAEDMVVARIAAGMTGGGYSPATAGSNVAAGLKGDDDNFLDQALGSVLGHDFMRTLGNNPAGVAGVTVVPAAPAVTTGAPTVSAPAGAPAAGTPAS